MANTHYGNTQPEIDQEEHARIGGLDGKKVFVMDNAGNQVTSFGGGSGNATVDIRNTVNANVSLGASAQYIGLVTNTPVGLHTLAPSPNYIGLASVNIGAGAAFIGHATVRIASNVNTNIGLVTIDGGTSKSLVSLMNSVANIGFVTVAIGANVNTNIGLVTIDGGTVKSLVSLGGSVQFIGLATVVPAFKSLTTVHTQIVSATGNTTIFVAPASNRFFIKNLHVSSLGRAEVEIRSGATTLIPFTSLSTTSGFAVNYGEEGLPSRAQADGFVTNLNGGATVAVMVNWYAAP